MMWYTKYYAVILAQFSVNRVSSFILDEDDMPCCWDTEEEAMAEMEGHPAWCFIEIVKLVVV